MCSFRNTLAIRELTLQSKGGPAEVFLAEHFGCGRRFWGDSATIQALPAGPLLRAFPPVESLTGQLLAPGVIEIALVFLSERFGVLHARIGEQICKMEKCS
jgi:hypothetical protein